MGKMDRKKAGLQRNSQSMDWREPLLRSPFFRVHFAAPLGLVGLGAIGYMLFTFVVFHHLSAFEARFILIALILSVIYTGFLNVVQREALGRWGVVRGAAAVWGGVVVMLLGVLMLIVYLAVVIGYL